MWPRVQHTILLISWFWRALIIFFNYMCFHSNCRHLFRKEKYVSLLSARFSMKTWTQTKRTLVCFRSHPLPPRVLMRMLDFRCPSMTIKHVSIEQFLMNWAPMARSRWGSNPASWTLTVAKHLHTISWTIQSSLLEWRQQLMKRQNGSLTQKMKKFSLYAKRHHTKQSNNQVTNILEVVNTLLPLTGLTLSLR